MLTVRGASKRYGPVQALLDVSAEFNQGEIHAVLGENGAGKSTLMGVLAGFVVPDTGHLTKNGAAVPLGRAHEAKRLGIAMVHQHFTLVPAFTVAENLAIAGLGSLMRSHDPLSDAKSALDLASELGWHLDPNAKCGDLAVGVQQRVEILKALAGAADTVIFDEPTAVLTPDEVLDLFRVLRSLRDAGKTLILIAHKLSEVVAIADRVTVLRKGRLVATAPIGEANIDQLAEWMVGESLPPMSSSAPASTGTQVLRVENLRVAGDRGETAVDGVTFYVASGEIFGIGGVDGNGQVELAEALAGVRHASVDLPSRVCYVPQDRQVDGLALSLSILDNLLIDGHRRTDLTMGPWIRSARVVDWANGLVQAFDIKIGRLTDPVSSLSGGNQQKVVVARNLDETPDLLVAVNPTRGLDVRSTRFVHSQIRRAADSGAAVVLFSTDLDELAALANRTTFMSRGKLVASKGVASLVGAS